MIQPEQMTNKEIELLRMEAPQFEIDIPMFEIDIPPIELDGCVLDLDVALDLDMEGNGFDIPIFPLHEID